MRPYDLIILDRDGVINEDSDSYIKSVDEFRPYPASLEAIARLKAAGITVAVATNQSSLARGYFDVATLDAMHAKLARELAAVDPAAKIDKIVYCPHHPDDGCDCRKPRPGMLLELMREFGAAREKTVFIGDNLSDLRAARAAGVAFVLVRTGKGERVLKKAADDEELRAELAGVRVFDDLAAAVEGGIVLGVSENGDKPG